MATQERSLRSRVAWLIGRTTWRAVQPHLEQDRLDPLRAEIARLQESVDRLTIANEVLRKEMLATNRRVAWNERSAVVLGTEH